MDLLPDVFSGFLPTSMKLVVLTILLVVILILIFRAIRLIAGKPVIKQAHGRVPRLAVSEVENLDDKRRLVLIRRDDVEHLVMIGGASDVLIEKNIIRTDPQQVQSAQYSDPAPVPDPVPDRQIADTSNLSHVPKTTPVAPAAVLSGISTATGLTSKKDDAAVATGEFGSVDGNSNTTDQGSSDELNLEMLSSLEEALGVEFADRTATDVATDVAPPISTHAQNQVGLDTVEISVPAAQPELATDKIEASVTPDRQSNKEDQMQKLLDELTGGTS